MTAHKNLNYSRRILLPFSSNGRMLVHVLVTVLLHGLPYGSAQAGRYSGGSHRRSGPSFNPKMAIIMLVLISFFFLVSFVSLLIHFCVLRNRSPPTIRPAGVQSGRRSAPHGLDVKAIEMFPTFAYSAVKGLKMGKDELECAICLSEFEDDETLRLIPHCNHVFHQKCVDKWLSHHATCPVCRTILLTEPGKTISFQTSDTDPTPIVDLEDGETDRRVTHSPDVTSVELTMWADRHSPGRMKSTESSDWNSTRSLPRSKSTGHASAIPSENLESFTLRLPEEVRNTLIKPSLDRTKHQMEFRRVRSSREGYRNSSIDQEAGRHNRFQRAFSLTDRFLALTGSVKSPSDNGLNEVGASAPKGFAESIKSPVSCLNEKKITYAGERSSDRLSSDNQV